MAALPDEIILHVFSFIDDGPTILAVALVCKRWHRIAQDPVAWSSVQLDWRGDDASERALIRAPFLRCLKMDYAHTAARMLFMSTLPRCDAVVLELQVLKNLCSTGHGGLAEFLWSKRDCLRRVHITAGDFTVTRGKGPDRSLADVLPHMHVLEELTLPSTISLPPPYGDLPALPQLRVLRFQMQHSARVAYPLLTAKSLLRQSAPNLQSLDIRPFNVADTLNVLDECVKLSIKLHRLSVSVGDHILGEIKNFILAIDTLTHVTVGGGPDAWLNIVQEDISESRPAFQITRK